MNDMKGLIMIAFAMTVVAGASFAAATHTDADTDPFFKEPTTRSLVLETDDGKRFNATISHKDACLLKPEAQLKIHSIEPYRKIWRNPTFSQAK